MRAIDAEPQLASELIDEMEVLAVRESAEFQVHAGRHPTLGRVVVIIGREGESVIVEVEE